RLFPTVFSGGHLEYPEVHYYRCTSIRVDSPASLDFYGDGEFICKTPFSLNLVPRALRVLVP
ncbi:MAG TPA: diacylglycerol kinase, partial [Thermodesulfobacteriota bacterium]|nr:diacylglycerol kinase [Thermodesulfobacteriota bacterium]